MKRSEEEEETTSPADDFNAKVNDLDFDPWGTEEEDGSVRRRDPLRKPVGHRPSDDEERV